MEWARHWRGDADAREREHRKPQHPLVLGPDRLVDELRHVRVGGRAGQPGRRLGRRGLRRHLLHGRAAAVRGAPLPVRRLGRPARRQSLHHKTEHLPGRWPENTVGLHAQVHESGAQPLRQDVQRGHGVHGHPDGRRGPLLAPLPVGAGLQRHPHPLHWPSCRDRRVQDVPVQPRPGHDGVLLGGRDHGHPVLPGHAGAPHADLEHQGDPEGRPRQRGGCQHARKVCGLVPAAPQPVAVDARRNHAVLRVHPHGPQPAAEDGGHHGRRPNAAHRRERGRVPHAHGAPPADPGARARHVPLPPHAGRRELRAPEDARQHDAPYPFPKRLRSERRGLGNLHVRPQLSVRPQPVPAEPAARGLAAAAAVWVPVHRRRHRGRHVRPARRLVRRVERAARVAARLADRHRVRQAHAQRRRERPRDRRGGTHRHFAAVRQQRLRHRVRLRFGVGRRRHRGGRLSADGQQDSVPPALFGHGQLLHLARSGRVQHRGRQPQAGDLHGRLHAQGRQRLRHDLVRAQRQRLPRWRVHVRQPEQLVEVLRRRHRPHERVRDRAAARQRQGRVRRGDHERRLQLLRLVAVRGARGVRSGLHAPPGAQLLRERPRSGRHGRRDAGGARVRHLRRRHGGRVRPHGHAARVHGGVPEPARNGVQRHRLRLRRGAGEALLAAAARRRDGRAKHVRRADHAGARHLPARRRRRRAGARAAGAGRGPVRARAILVLPRSERTCQPEDRAGQPISWGDRKHKISHGRGGQGRLLGGRRRGVRRLQHPR